MMTLEEAHARIRELEAEIREASRSPGRPARDTWQIIVGLMFVAVIVGIAVWSGLRLAARGGAASDRPAVVVEERRASAPSPRARERELSFECIGPYYPDGPSFLDLDGDGVREIITLAWWRDHHDDLPLHVVALDRATFHVKWRSRAFPARCGGADLMKRLHVGKVAPVSTPQVFFEDDSGRVHLLDSRDGTDLNVFGPAVRVEEREGLEGYIDHRLPPRAPTTDAHRAAIEKALRKTNSSAPLPSGMTVASFDLWDDQDNRVSIATVKMNDLDVRSMVFRFDEKNQTDAPTYQMALHGPDQQALVDSPNWNDSHTMLSNGKLAHLYQRASDSRYAISIRNAKTGALIGDYPLVVDGDVPLGAGAPIGSGVTADGDDVAFYLGDALVLFNMTEHTTRSLRTF